MRKTRSYVLGLVAALAAAIATSSPSALPVVSPTAGHVNLGSGLAGVPLALSAASYGRMDRVGLQQAAARNAEAASVAGVPGSGRSVVGIGDVNGDLRADLLDLRANEMSLTVTGVSGRNGSALWTLQFTGLGTIFGAAYPATIDADGHDAYLLVQSANEGLLNWSLYALDGATGASRWTQSGVVPSGLPTIPPPTPTIPPTLPPVPPVIVPTSVPTAVPTELPTAAPTTVPTVVPTAVPTSLPTAAPTAQPTTLPTTAPTTPPTSVPSPEPTAVPTAPPTLPPLPSPPATPGASGQSRASSANAPAENENLPVTIEAFAFGLKPVDVDGDNRTDFPLVVYETAVGPDSVPPVIAATLVTLKASDGSTAGLIAAVGRGGVPHVGVAGDMTSDGLPDLIASDEILEPSAGVAATTWRAAAGNGRPLWIAADQFDAGSVGVVDARSDVTGDHIADLVVHRLPAAGSGKQALLRVRTGFSGMEVWNTRLPEASVVTVGPRLNADEAADIITQAVVGTTPETIPEKVSYRSFSGVDGVELHVGDYAFPCAGCPGAWAATLVSDAGDLDADGSNDLTHSIAAFPATAASASSQAGVNARTLTSLWKLECACAPSTPVQANLAAGPGQDLIEAKEVVTRLTDAISLRAASGNDAASLWQTSVVVGTGNDRIESIALAPADLTGAGAADLLVTAVQRSGTVMRSVVVAVRGSTGRIIWIRTK